MHSVASMFTSRDCQMRWVYVMFQVVLYILTLWTAALHSNSLTNSRMFQFVLSNIASARNHFQTHKMYLMHVATLHFIRCAIHLTSLIAPIVVVELMSRCNKDWSTHKQCCFKFIRALHNIGKRCGTATSSNYSKWRWSVETIAGYKRDSRL